jgi:hypothetical protein
VVAVVCFCWLYAGPIPESVALSSADRAAILFEGVVCAVGGPLVGVMVGRWTRFPGAGLVAVAVLVGWSVLGTLSEAMSATRLSTLARLNVPFTTWVGGPIDNHPWVPGGSPEWYLAYLTLLCGLAATAAMLHEASGAQRTSLERALIVLAVLAVATLALAAAGDPTRIPL